ANEGLDRIPVRNAGERLGEIPVAFALGGHGHELRPGRRDRVRLLERVAEEILPLFVGEELRYLDRAAEVEAPDVVTIQRPREAHLVIEKVIGVESLIPQEVVGAAEIL